MQVERILKALKLCALVALIVAVLLWSGAGPASASGVVVVSAGGGHTCALTTAGNVKCWGSNGIGEVGDGTTGNNRLTPVDVCATGAIAPCRAADNNILTGVVALSPGGRSHTCVLTTVGGVKCWGYNSTGQLGNGTITSSATPVDVLSDRGGMPLSAVAAVAAGNDHTCALTTAGGVKCWGWNQFGQLGATTTESCLGTPCSTIPLDVSGLTSGVTAVTGGGEYTCALTKTGGVKCWGLNGVGQLGDGTNLNVHASPVDVCATGATPPCTEAKGNILTDVRAIDAGRYHACALAAGGGVKCWGWNLYGQLGDGTSGGLNSRTTPVDVCATGSGPGCMAGSPLSDVVAISAGGDGGQTCALTTAETIKCWGENGYGQLGNGTTTGLEANPNPVDACATGATPPCVGAEGDILTGVDAVTSGRVHTCVLVTGGRAKCWGLNSFGQLGDAQGCGTFSCSTPVDVMGPKGVGGIAELPELAGTPLEASDEAGRNVRVLAGIGAAAAAGAVALGGAAWYAKRRWSR